METILPHLGFEDKFAEIHANLYECRDDIPVEGGVCGAR
jgi:hypothetical protein